MPNLKQIKTKKSRDEAGLFLIEGEKFIAEIPEKYNVLFYVISQKYAETHDFSRHERRARCEIVRDSVLEKLADTVTPQGIIAVCEKILYKPDDVLSEIKSGFVLMGENLNDPGNVGALVRTATAAGASAVILTRGSCDVFSPKVIRAAAGAVLRLPIIANAEPCEIFDTLAKCAVKIYAAHPRGEFLPYDLNMREKFCLLVGNESHGISDAALARADATVRLPMTNETESLNASIAGSVLLYEAVRQRANA
ncbi:MAG: RNA methyltransferase [Defluviitaleaceae bacterium]|nr:RNA methyltransferase [Defluviitaleaceae bacterium]